MIRKFAAALVALVLTFGAVFAEDVKAVFVKYADGKLTVKVDDKEKEYTIPADLKVKRKFGKDAEEKEFVVREMLSNNKLYKEGSKLIIVTEGDKVTDVKRDRSK